MEAIYARQSLDKKDSLSIETQIEICKLECGGSDVKVYVDRGYSGANVNRPQFTKLMEDLEQGRISRVIVYRVDRLSRSLLDFASMIKTFHDHGVEFLSTREKFDTGTPIGNAMLSIVMVFAELERETIRLRVKDSYNARSGRGAYDSMAPYGYRKSRVEVADKMISTLEIDPGTSLIVKEMFDLYAFTDQSLGMIAKSLNRRGIPSPNGAEWDSGKLSRIMANPIYVMADADVYRYFESTGIRITNPIDDFTGQNGCVTYGAWDRKRRKFSQWDSLALSIGLHPGIIAPDVYLRCQRKLNANVQLGNEGRGKYTWLTGLTKCGYCGRAMRVVASGRAGYRLDCSGRTNYGTCDAYSKRWLMADVEACIEAELFRIVEKKRELVATIERQEDVREKQLKIQVAKIEQKIGNLLDGLAEASGVTIGYLNEKIRELEEEKRKLLQDWQKEKQDLPADSRIRQLGDVPYLWDAMTVEQKREIAKLLMDRVLLYNDRVEIRWKYNFEAELIPA